MLNGEYLNLTTKTCPPQGQKQVDRQQWHVLGSLKEIWHSFLVGILGTYVEWRIFAPYHKHTLTHTLKAKGVGHCGDTTCNLLPGSIFRVVWALEL